MLEKHPISKISSNNLAETRWIFIKMSLSRQFSHFISKGGKYDERKVWGDFERSLYHSDMSEISVLS